MGPWGIAAIVLAGAGATEKGREMLRQAAKCVIKAGYTVADKSSGALGELKEQAADLVAEAKAERDGAEEPASKAKNGRRKISLPKGEEA